MTRFVVLEGDEPSFLRLLAGIEAQSEHPIAGAIRREMTRRGLVADVVSEVTTAPSEGIIGRDGTGTLWAGNPRMVARMQASLDHPGLKDVMGGSETVVYLGRGSTLIGAIAVADQPRESSARAIAALRAGGVEEVAMMTGDRRPVALRIAEKLGLTEDEVHADLLPQDKVDLVDALARQGRVAFVGDGVNDAAARRSPE